MNGVVAASGKLGAIISQLVIYSQLRDPKKVNKTGIQIMWVSFVCYELHL